MSFPFKRQHPVIPLVTLLQHVCRPAAVLFAEKLGVVNALNAVASCRPWAHVKDESYKRSSPFLANSDAAPSVHDSQLASFGLRQLFFNALQIPYSGVCFMP